MKLAVIGDVHGCYDELIELSKKIQGYRPVFVGDLVDRGPKNYACFKLAYDLWSIGEADWIMGNHDNKFFRWLKGNPVTIRHGLELTVNEFKKKFSPLDFNGMSMEELGEYMLDRLPYVIKGDDFIIAHAFPCGSSKAMYGPTDDDRNRIAWWEDHKGDFAVFGHYWLNDPEPRDNWCCVDTSCCLGGKLTALLLPERKIVSVQSKWNYDEIYPRDT